ncbi:MAG: ribonuclease P protein component [Syntrophomonadaceae bacterium]|jgi:ribonuclease P protein component
MLSREFRISAGKEYNNIYKSGKRIQGRYMVLFYQPNNQGINRFGFVTSKKVGKAVTRNQVKRRLREIVRKNELDKKGFNIIIVARYNIGEVTSDLLEKDFKIITKKAGLW